MTSDIIKKRLHSQRLENYYIAILEDAQGKFYLLTEDPYNVNMSIFDKDIKNVEISKALEYIGGLPINEEIIKHFEDEDYKEIRINFLCSALYRFAMRMKTDLSDLIFNKEKLTIYSINEDTIFEHKSEYLFGKRLANNVSIILKKCIEEDWGEIKDEIELWQDAIKENKEICQVLDIIQYSQENLLKAIATLTNIEFIKSIL